MHDHLFEVDIAPPFLDMTKILQRADEVSAIQRMLTDPQTSTVLLVGEAGVGKSTLAALLYHRLMMAKKSGLPSPYHLVWLSMSTYTTFPDMLAALLNSLHAVEPDFPLLKPTQQISALLRALRRSEESAFVVLDQFEELLRQDAAGTRMSSNNERELTTLFLELLQTNLGSSRMLLTNREMLFKQQDDEESSVRTYVVSRINTVEATTLLQRYGVGGTAEELSTVWQRCSGHIFSLVLFCALVHVSGISAGTLLFSNDYQAIWRSDVMQQLLALLYQHLNLMQRHILRGLSLFDEPVSMYAIIATMSNENESFTMLSSNRQFMSRFERELQMLTRLSMLQPVSRVQEEMRFMLHPLVRQYVLAHYVEGEQQQGQVGASLGVSGPLNPLAANPEAQKIALAAGQKKVATYYYMLMREQYPPRERRTSIQDVAPVIAAIRHLCLAYQWQAACDLLFAEGLHQSLARWGAWRTLANLYTSLLPPLGILQRRDEGLVACLLATLQGQLGNYSQSQTYFDHALKVQREIGDRRGGAVTLANRGELCRMRGESVQAKSYFEQAISLNKQQQTGTRQDMHLHCIVLHNMGLLYHGEKNYVAAFNYYIRALHLTYKLQDQYDKATILTNLGLLLYEQGQHRDALAVLLAALTLRQKLQDTGVTFLARFLFGVEQKMGAEAYARLCQEALATQEEVFARLMTVKETA